MDVSWDADNFEPKLPTTLTTSNRWEGEDEEDTVKESWEDEEEEKKDEEKKEQPAPPAAKPKKKIQDKIAEKERLQREKAERVAVENMTPEEIAAEKMRMQKLQEESDLRLAMETFGVVEGSSGKLDSFHPTTPEEFAEFGELLIKKIGYYKTKDEFPGFVDDLVRNILAHMGSADIKRIKMTVDNIYIEKQKAEKNDKGKKTNKGKGKAKLKVEGDNAHLNQYDAYGNFDTDDFDDFM